MTEILVIDRSSPAETPAAAVARSLESGAIVALPTETVFGLFVRGDDPAAVERLYALKGRDERKPLAHYLASPIDAHEHPDLGTPGASRLLRAFWPGPLTIVVGGDDDQETSGFRCPAQPFLSMVLSRCRFPVVGTSANPSGHPPAVSAREVAALFPDGLATIIEDAEPASGTASTVVLVPRHARFDPLAPAPYRILRAGSIDETTLATELAPRVLFVCTGNTCRSPLAEVIAAELVGSRHGPEVRSLPGFYSAGTAAHQGQAASSGARAVAAERGLDLGGHRSRLVTQDLLERMDQVYVMTRAHAADLVRAFGKEGPPIELLDPSGRDLADPYGQPDSQYRIVADQIRSALLARLETR